MTMRVNNMHDRDNPFQQFDNAINNFCCELVKAFKIKEVLIFLTKMIRKII